MILAIDPSLRCTAAAFGDEHGFTMETFSSVGYEGDSAYERVTRYRGMVGQLARWLTGERPDAIFIEGYSFGSNDARAKFLAEYGGILRNRLIEFTTNIWEIPPARLKRFITGKGSGKKEGVKAAIERDYSKVFQTDDEYDAFALYRLGLCAMGLCETVGRAQAEVVYQLFHPAPRKKKTRRKGPRKAKEKRLFT